MTNQPAFPQPVAIDSHGNIHTSSEQSDGGMTLRDYFAGIAMGQLCRNGDDAQATAHYAYAYADAMLAERGK